MHLSWQRVTACALTSDSPLFEHAGSSLRGDLPLSRCSRPEKIATPLLGSSGESIEEPPDRLVGRTASRTNLDRLEDDSPTADGGPPIETGHVWALAASTARKQFRRFRKGDQRLQRQVDRHREFLAGTCRWMQGRARILQCDSWR